MNNVIPLNRGSSKQLPKFELLEESAFAYGDGFVNRLKSGIMLVSLVIGGVGVMALTAVFIFNSLSDVLGEFTKVTAVAITSVLAGAVYYIYITYKRRKINRIIKIMRIKESHIYR